MMNLVTFTFATKGVFFFSSAPRWSRLAGRTTLVAPRWSVYQLVLSERSGPGRGEGSGF